MEGREYYRRLLDSGKRTLSCFVLNSATLAHDPVQLEWLARELSADSSDYRLLLLHRPLLETFRPEGTLPIARLLRPILEGGPRIDAIFSADRQGYQRVVDHAGIQHVSLGSHDGLTASTESPDVLGLPIRRSRQQVFGWLTLDRNGLSFHAYGDRGDLIDSFHLPPLDVGGAATRAGAVSPDHPG